MKLPQLGGLDLAIDIDRESVERRCSTEWSNGHANSITWEKARAWIDQFRPEDRKYAAKLLKYFQLYGYGKMVELVSFMHGTLLKDTLVARYFPVGGGTSDDRTDKFRQELSHSLFIPAQSENKPESAHQVAYIYRTTNLDVPDHCFVDSITGLRSRIKDDTWNLIFLNDFVGSGREAIRCYRNYVAPLLKRRKDLRVYLLICIGVANGIRTIEQETSCEVVSGMVLDDAARAFSSRSDVFEDLETSEAEKVIRSYGEQLWSEYPLGFEDGQLLIGFDWGPPDNTITPIWWPNSENWIPLLPRRLRGGK